MAAPALPTPGEWAASEGQGQEGNGWRDGEKSVQTIEEAAMAGDYASGILN